MERLSQADLIVKNVDGSFHLTPYGEQVLTLVPILDFLSKHRDYFLTHILSAIPYHSRIGLAALQDCNLINDVMVTFHNIEEIIKKSKEYV